MSLELSSEVSPITRKRVGDTGRGITITEEPAFRNYWYPVAQASALDGGPVARRLLGEDLVLWRSGPSEVSAAEDRCPHRAARLSTGWVDDCAIVCPYHGWEYAGDGRARRIPQLREGVPIPPGAVVNTYLCQEHWEWIWVCLGDPVLPLPEVPEINDPAWRVVHEPESTWSVSALQLVDNNIDASHVAFVHKGTFGSPSKPHVPVPHVEATPTGIHSTNDFIVQSRPGETGEMHRHSAVDLYGPFLIYIRTTYDDGLVNLMLKGCTPIDDDNTRQVQQILRPDSEEDRPGADIIAFDEEVWREDKAVLEPAWPCFHTSPTANMHLRTDRLSIEYRKMIATIVAGKPW